MLFCRLLIMIIGFYSLSTMPSEAGLLGKVKHAAKKAKKKIKKTAKNPGKELGKTAKKTTKNIRKTAKKGLKTIKNTVKNPTKCIKSGAEVAKLLSQAASKKWPKNFCKPIKTFISAGCLGMTSVALKVASSKVSIIKKLKNKLTTQACDCVSRVGEIAINLKNVEFTKQTCDNIKKARMCCQKVLTFPPFSTACKTMNKTIGKAFDKGCKKIAGTCPALVASESIIVTKIIAQVAGTVASSEAGPVTYIPLVMQIIDSVQNTCRNVQDMTKKQCCKKLGPLKKACSPIMKLGSGVCTQLDCPLKIVDLVKSPSCSGLKELTSSGCCKRVSKMPLGFGKLFAPLCKMAEQAVKKTVGKACGTFG